jgi:hypothetical protein
MPYAPDKVIINGPRPSSLADAIGCEFETARKLCDELEDNNIDLAKTKPFRDRMRIACAEHLAGDMKYLAFMQKWNDDLGAFIDDELDARGSSAPLP